MTSVKCKHYGLCGVHPRMLKVTQSFHKGMLVEVRVGSLPLRGRNGLLQGCTLVSLLFNTISVAW